MSIPAHRGLKFPDDFVIKFFFKNRLHTRTGRVLELGCGNGSNLLLFHEYGWSVVGLEINRDSLADATHNFSLTNRTDAQHRLIHQDLSLGLGTNLNGKFDVILLPNVLYYIPRHSMVAVLKELRTYVSTGTLIFLRNRSVRDYRYRRGDEIERNGYRLTGTDTGEHGSLNVFYHEWELMDTLREHLALNPNTAVVLSVEYQNPQEGTLVNNSDIVIWGSLGR